jgi:hypothetical protein
VGYVLTGLADHGLPRESVGYVYLPALIGVSIASVALAPLGARIASAMPMRRLKRAFAVFLLLLAVSLVWRLWH